MFSSLSHAGSAGASRGETHVRHAVPAPASAENPSAQIPAFVRNAEAIFARDGIPLLEDSDPSFFDENFSARYVENGYALVMQARYIGLPPDGSGLQFGSDFFISNDILLTQDSDRACNSTVGDTTVRKLRDALVIDGAVVVGPIRKILVALDLHQPEDDA
jgi:hypothetical protein